MKLSNLIFSTLLLLIAVNCTKDIKNKNAVESFEANQSEKLQDSTVGTDAMVNSGFSKLLQGSWERTSYPSSSIEFKGDQVRISAGEGARIEAKFQNFTIQDDCPGTSDTAQSTNAYDYLVITGNDCQSIKLNKNILTINYSGSEDGIKYKKTTSTLVSEIPKIFQGKWTVGKGNCNEGEEQMQILPTELKFFKNKAELVEITQLEPTRLEAKFKYYLPNGKTADYFYTLDLQDKTQVLIMRENGDQSRPGPIQYEKCN